MNTSSIPKDRLGLTLDNLKKSGGVKEAVLLSTCNRLEVYARPEKNYAHSIHVISEFLYSLSDADAQAGSL